MRVGFLARVLLTLDVLLEAATAVNDEIATHIHCLQQHELTPEDRDHIERNLAACCARGLQLIAIHQLMLKGQLDQMALASFSAA